MGEDDDEINPSTLPIYKKGREIYDLVRKICELIPDDNGPLNSIKPLLIEDAAMLSVKVAGATGADLYDIQMECATIIRKAARDLKVQSHSLEMFGFKEVHYYEMVRELIEEYRLLFIDWVASFDQWNYIVDDWGLFNPPGIEPE